MSESSDLVLDVSESSDLVSDSVLLEEDAKTRTVHYSAARQFKGSTLALGL